MIYGSGNRIGAESGLGVDGLVKETREDVMGSVRRRGCGSLANGYCGIN